MELETQDWKEFRLGDLFDIQGTATTKIDTLAEEYGIGEYPYITTQATNNGTAGYYNYYTENGNVLVADSAVAGYVSYQSKCFSASDHVEKLIPKFDMNKYIALFLVTILNCENCRYSYGRKFNQTNIKQTIIKLPAKSVTNETGKSIYEPDWQFMEDYIKSLKCELPLSKIAPNKNNALNIADWKEFRLGDLFDKTYKALPHTKEEVVETQCGRHFVSRTYENNGIDMNVKDDDIDGIESENCLVIGDTTASCFYQNKPFITGDHIVVLRANWLNKYTGAFLKTLIDQERFRYCYGRAYKMDLIKETIIKLPAKSVTNKTGKSVYEPDWKFMEDYIKSLPYSNLI
jgi:hypothetical protein